MLVNPNIPIKKRVSMLKQGLIYCILSIIVVLFAKYIHLLIVYIDMLYTYIYVQLASIFYKNNLSAEISKIILLVLIPTLIAVIPALVYRLFKGKKMPYFIELTWCLWLVIVLSNVLIG